MRLFLILVSVVLICIGYYLFFERPAGSSEENKIDTIVIKNIKDSPITIKTVEEEHPVFSDVSTKRDSIIAFAQTLIGTPYLYAGQDPAKGFDCSGFINYVFNHFQMTVPRSSFDFINIGRKTILDSCKKGDLILFTGTNPEEKNIGHIGIVFDTKTKYPSFIHSSSGKANGVTVTSMESVYYQNRFVAVVDILSK